MLRNMMLSDHDRMRVPDIFTREGTGVHEKIEKVKNVSVVSFYDYSWICTKKKQLLTNPSLACDLTLGGNIFIVDTIKK